MSCINLSIGFPHTGGMSSAAGPTGWFGTETKNRNPQVTAFKTGDMHLDILLVCRAAGGVYLRVKPSATLWITVDKSISYDVRSNTDWFVH